MNAQHLLEFLSSLNDACDESLNIFIKDGYRIVPAKKLFYVVDSTNNDKIIISDSEFDNE